MLHDEINRICENYASDKNVKVTNIGKALFETIANNKAVGFYFDETLRDAIELQETAKDFFKNGVLVLPFNHCVFHINNFYKDRGPLIILACQLSPTAIAIVDCGMINGRFGIAGGGCFLNHEGVRTFKLIENWDPNKDREGKILRFRITSTMTMICAMMMNHPAYLKDEKTPDEKLQKSRLKRGKPLLSKYIYVNMKPHIKAALTAGDGSIRAPHWRRGHVRRLADGRVVPVQACLVNWEGEATDPGAPEKKIYVI